MSAANTSNVQTAALACYDCKRRKIKCDRILPVCSPCSKSSRECDFPTSAQRPGPKPRTPRRASTVVADSTFIPNAQSAPEERSLVQQIATSDGRNVRAIEADAADPAAAAFTDFTYPCDSGRTRPTSPAARAENASTQASYARGLDNIFHRMHISLDLGSHLLQLYFSNMTSFCLFTEDMMEAKLSFTTKILDAQVLLAAMFSFSARFQDNSLIAQAGNYGQHYSSAHFAEMASEKIGQALEEYGDATPSLCLLQAYVLLAFYELSHKVQAKAWRLLGQCIRVAYELKLHLVDQDVDTSTDSAPSNAAADTQKWAEREEKRRAWWTIWEMDVFASTIRRLPTAIDWAQNLTLLPISDQDWIDKSFQKSCFLLPDSNQRWKALVDSQNRSGKAWFILINSLMRNTQVLVYSQGRPKADRNAEDREVELLSLANALFCAISSLPEELVYRGEVLPFRASDETDVHRIQLQMQTDKYSLHMMTQLSHFMINHHHIRAQAPWLMDTGDTGASQSAQMHRKASDTEWFNYMSAAEEIVVIVRNSSVHHPRHVNPFLINTLWFAAAAQCSCRVLGPPSLSRHRRLVDSNLELLRLTMDRFINFWGSTDKLKDKLSRMESGLRSLMERRTGLANAQSTVHQQQTAPPTTNLTASFTPGTGDLETGTTLSDWASMPAPNNFMYEGGFDDMHDAFPFGLDDLLVPYNNAFFNIDL